MKELLIVPLLLMGLISFSQSIGYFRYDSTRLEKVGGNNELILLNGTRSVTNGVLTNIGNGRTAFVTPTAGVAGGNLGAGYRYYVPSSQGVKTTIADNGLTLDSATSNTLTYKLGGTLTANTSIAQAGFNMTYSGTGALIVGNAISTSLGRLQVKNPTANTQHAAFGEFLSNNVYLSNHPVDTLTTASYKSTGFFSRYKHVVNANFDIAGWGGVTEMHIVVPDTLRGTPVGSDLMAGFMGRMLLEPNTAQSTGRHVLKGGTFRDDYVGGVIGMHENLNSTSSNWIYRKGYWSSVTAHYVTGNSKDSIDNYAGFASMMLNSGWGGLANQFYAGPAGGFDTVRSFSAPYSNAYMLQAGPAYFGSAETGNYYAPHASAQVEIYGTTKGVLLPRMTATQKNAISSPATGLIVYDTDSAYYFQYNGSAWEAMKGSGGGGGGSGTVTDFIFTDGSGFDGTVTSSTTTPTLSLTTTAADTRVMYSTSGAITGSGQFTFTGQALQLASTNTTETTTSSSFYLNPSALTTGTAAYVPTTTLTSGNLLNLVSTSTALASGNELLNLDVSGANGTNAITATGMRISVTNTNATSGTNVGLESTASGATTANIGIRSTPNIYVGAVSANAVDGIRIKNPGNGNYDGYYVESSGGTTGTTYGYAGITRGGGLTFKTTSGSISIAPASGSGVYIGTEFTTATAYLHIKAGTATASTAPLKLTAGTNNTTPEAGAIEFDGTNFFATASTTRYTLAKTLKATATLDFPTIAVGDNEDLTITVTGAATGDPVALAIPTSEAADGTCVTAWVSGTNTVTVRFNNYRNTSFDPNSASYTVAVLHY